jgi:hypothetical protein
LPSSKPPSTDNASLTRQKIKISNNKGTSQKTNTNNAFLQKDLQKENIKNSSLPSPDNVSTRPLLNLISQNKTNTFQPTTPTLPLLTKNHVNNTTHANSASILSLTSDNIHLATRQQDKHSMTSLTSNYQFNNNTHLAKKQMQTINRTSQN